MRFMILILLLTLTTFMSVARPAVSPPSMIRGEHYGQDRQQDRQNVPISGALIYHFGQGRSCFLGTVGWPTFLPPSEHEDSEGHPIFSILRSLQIPMCSEQEEIEIQNPQNSQNSIAEDEEVTFSGLLHGPRPRFPFPFIVHHHFTERQSKSRKRGPYGVYKRANRRSAWASAGLGCVAGSGALEGRIFLVKREKPELGSFEAMEGEGGAIVRGLADSLLHLGAQGGLMMTSIYIFGVAAEGIGTPWTWVVGVADAVGFSVGMFLCRQGLPFIKHLPSFRDTPQ